MKYILILCIISLLCSIVECGNVDEETIDLFWNIFGHEKINKRYFSQYSRLLLVMGLEGSGHHALAAVVESCQDRNLCGTVQDLTHSIINHDARSNNVYGLFGAADSNKDYIEILEVLQELTEIAANADKKQPKLNYIALGSTPKSGMLSYPDFNGNYKTLDHPDAHVLAALSEAAGVDLRLLVIQRPAAEILRSTDSRGMASVVEPKVLIANAEAMYMQLKLLDRSFYRCVQYNELGSMKEKEMEELASFLHPTSFVPSAQNNKKMESIFPEMLSTIEYSNKTDEQLTPTLRYHQLLLQHRIDMINELCSK